MAAVDVTKKIWEKEQSKLDDLKEEIANCIIRAPRDGMVVYYTEERARFGQSQGVIAQGEQVKEGQKLLAVPDLTQMVVNARVHESVVPQVRDDKILKTGFSDAVKGLLALTPDPLSNLCGYEAFHLEGQSAFSKANAEYEKIQQQHGLPATVLLNAFPDRPFQGHVKWVSPVPSQTDFFSSDVKVYQTFIAVDDSNLEGVRPGMDAAIIIRVDSTPEPVVQIPLQALFGGVEMADKRYCFVRVDGRLQRREIALGKANEKFAEVKDGLQEGDEVVLNPALLMSDKDKAQYGASAPSSQGGKGGKGMRPGGGRRGGPGGRKGGQGGSPSAPGKQGGPGGGYGGGGRRSQAGAAPGAKTPSSP